MTNPSLVSPDPRLTVQMFRSKIRFYGNELLAPLPTSKLEDPPLRLSVTAWFSCLRIILSLPDEIFILVPPYQKEKGAYPGNIKSKLFQTSEKYWIESYITSVLQELGYRLTINVRRGSPRNIP